MAKGKRRMTKRITPINDIKVVATSISEKNKECPNLKRHLEKRDEELKKTVLAQKAEDTDVDKIMDKGYKEAKEETPGISEGLRKNVGVLPPGNYDLPYKAIKISGDDAVKYEKTVIEMHHKGFILISIHTIYNGESMLLFADKK